MTNMFKSTPLLCSFLFVSTALSYFASTSFFSSDLAAMSKREKSC